MKTNAMRILDGLGIPYEIRTYAWDGEHIDAVSAAERLGIEAERVCKTIVTRDPANAVFVFCLPAPCEISMKKARALIGVSPIDLVRRDELRTLTGYIRGGVSPLGMIHSYPTFIEETVRVYERICVSAGARGVQLELSPDDLLAAAHALWADLV